MGKSSKKKLKGQMPTVLVSAKKREEADLSAYNPKEVWSGTCKKINVNHTSGELTVKLCMIHGFRTFSEECKVLSGHADNKSHDMNTILKKVTSAILKDNKRNIYNLNLTLAPFWQQDICIR